MSSLLVVEALARHTSSGETASVGDVATFCDVEHSTASRLVDRAVRSGLVARAPSQQDARRSALALTADGTVVRDRATAFRTHWLAEVLSQWSPDDVTAFAAALHRFAASVEQVPLGQGQSGQTPLPGRAGQPWIRDVPDSRGPKPPPSSRP
jgi:DNA-binding MarR family transcriptional regulator